MNPLHRHKVMSVGYQVNLKSRSWKLVHEKSFGKVVRKSVLLLLAWDFTWHPAVRCGDFNISLLSEGQNRPNLCETQQTIVRLGQNMNRKKNSFLLPRWTTWRSESTHTRNHHTTHGTTIPHTHDIPFSSSPSHTVSFSLAPLLSQFSLSLTYIPFWMDVAEHHGYRAAV